LREKPKKALEEDEKERRMVGHAGRKE